MMLNQVTKHLSSLTCKKLLISFSTFPSFVLFIQIDHCRLRRKDLLPVFDHINSIKTPCSHLKSFFKRNLEQAKSLLLLGEACMFPKSTNETFENKLFQSR